MVDPDRQVCKYYKDDGENHRVFTQLQPITRLDSQAD